jgi:hypothetical protein
MLKLPLSTIVLAKSKRRSKCAVQQSTRTDAQDTVNAHAPAAVSSEAYALLLPLECAVLPDVMTQRRSADAGIVSIVRLYCGRSVPNMLM